MTYRLDQSAKRKTVSTGSDRSYPDHPGRNLHLYDKNARSVAEAHTTLPWYEAQAAPGLYTDYTLVQATIKKTGSGHLLIREMLQQGVVLVLEAERGIAVQWYPNGDLSLHCMIVPLQDRAKVTGIEELADEAVRSFLKGCYAGWHHVYHEVLAMASGFSTVPVCNTPVVEWIRPGRIPRGSRHNNDREQYI